MKTLRIAKTFVAIAATFAATGAWADTTVDTYRNAFSTAETFTFSTLVEGSGYVWIGSTSGAFDDAWCYWVSQDGTENCGINQTADYMRIADAANQKGRLCIESGYYKTPKFNIGDKGVAYLTMNGGKIETTGQFNVGINGATAEFLMTGGTVNINGEGYWAADANTTATATISNGTMTITKSLTLINGNGSTGTINIGEGGKLICNSDVLLASGGDTTSTATININNGGVWENQTTGGGAIWIKLSNSGTSKSVININEGGIVKAWHFQQISTGESEVNFNGGTMIALGSDSTYNKYLFGDTDNKGNDAHLTITVGEKGGTIDTNGKDITINKEIAGTGTLTITGGGTMTFSAKPTCPVLLEDGIIAVTPDTTPGNLTLGTNGFISYDLSSHYSITEDETTTYPAPQTLAANVTISAPEGDTVAEHVIIKSHFIQGNERHSDSSTDAAETWVVSYDDANGTLTATATAPANAGDVAVWTGYVRQYYCPRSNNYATRWDWQANWTGGLPTTTTTAIIPYAANIYCESGATWNKVSIRTTGNVKFYNNNGAYHTVNVGTVEGDGTISLAGWIGLLSTTVNVPVEIGYETVWYNDSWPYRTVYLGSDTFNGTVTIPADVPCDFENCTINADLVVDGTANFRAAHALKGAISGGGTIAGSFTTADGAKICATVTNENATAECLTVTGTADLANATVEIAGGELVADAAYGTEIVLLKANAISNWTKSRYVIPGQSKSWKIETGTLVENETTYAVLKAVKTQQGFVIVVQ